MADATRNEPDPQIKYGPEQKPWGEQVPDGATIKPPSEDPIKVYPRLPPSDVKGDFPLIDYKLFEIPPTGLTTDQHAAGLAALKDYVTTQQARFTGYQTNEALDYSDRLAWLLDIHTNNVGDPFQTGIFTLNTKFVERAVLDYFAALWNVDWPHHDDSATQRYRDRYWGYVLSMGSTEANIYGMFNARDYLKGKSLIEDSAAEGPEPEYIYAHPLDDETNPNAYRPIVFYSEDTHYSVVKAMRILEMTTFFEVGSTKYPGLCPITANGEWPLQVPSHDRNTLPSGEDNPISGTIKVDDLEKLVRFFADKGHPIAIVLNIGSTWKGAYDDVPAVNDMLVRLGKEYPWLWERRVKYGPDLEDTRRGFWVHVDGALGGSYLPFLEIAHKRGLIEKGKPYGAPIFDFRNDAVMSVCSSLHKWFGAPWPGAVYLTRTGYQLSPPSTPSYIGAADTTLGGSRNAFSAVLYWDYLARNGYEQSVAEVVRAEKIGTYFEEQLRQLESELKQKFGPDVDLWISRSRLSLAVRFRLVSPTIKYKFTVDAERIPYPLSDTTQQYRSFSHIYLMQSLTHELADELIAELREASKDDWHNAFPEKDGTDPNPGPEQPIPTPPRRPVNYILSMPHRGRGLGSFTPPLAKE
jgi:histidine decarboxylase